MAKQREGEGRPLWPFTRTCVLMFRQTPKPTFSLYIQNAGVLISLLTSYLASPQYSDGVLMPGISPTQSPLQCLANIPGWAKSSIDNAVMESPKTSLPPVHESAPMHENQDPLTVKVSMQLPDQFKYNSTASLLPISITQGLEMHCNSPVELYCTGFCRDNPPNMEDGIGRPDMVGYSVTCVLPFTHIHWIPDIDFVRKG